jgi:threonine/homoserine efflux transporter RhtA
MILRRLYLYLVSAASLGVLTVGLALLGTIVLLFVFNDSTAQDNRTALAAYTAMVLVAGPVWAVHFWFARHFAMRDPGDRASAIRRLYL